MESVRQLDLSTEDINLLLDILAEAVEIQEDVIEKFIEDDQTPDTVEEFLGAVASAADYIANLKTLQERVKRLT